MNTDMNDELRAHLRMAFAALAMQALIPIGSNSGLRLDARDVADSAVQFADALIMALAMPIQSGTRT